MEEPRFHLEFDFPTILACLAIAYILLRPDYLKSRDLQLIAKPFKSVILLASRGGSGA